MHAVRSALSLVGALALIGCASPDRAADGGPPADLCFSIVRAAATPTDDRRVESDPAGWFVLEPGGLLRGALGERTRDTPLPPPIRTLSPAQVGEVYELAVAAGLADPASGAGEACADGTPAPPGGLVVYSAQEGRRRTRVVEEMTPACEALWSRLFELAWARR